jgi:hypothetical protein
MNGKQRHRLGQIGRLAEANALDGRGVRKAIEEVLAHDYARMKAAQKAAGERGIFVQGLDDRDDEHLLGEHPQLADIWPSAAYIAEPNTTEQGE